jgi:hypothetical protein
MRQFGFCNLYGRKTTFAVASLLSMNSEIDFWGTATASESSIADRYLECVSQEANKSARRHVVDKEVTRSSVPAKVLLILVEADVSTFCKPLFHEVIKSDDFAGPAMKAYDTKKSAVDAALAGSPPPPHSPMPGSDDYTDSEKLDPGAWQLLSIECRALLAWDNYTVPKVPKSCSEDARRANRLYEGDVMREDAELLENPTVRYCLALRSLEEIGNEPLPSSKTGNPFDAYQKLNEASKQEYQKLEAALDDKSGALDNCLSRIRAAGGLVFVDPAHEMARVNRIPDVKQASDQYAKCTTDRAIDFARASKEPAEVIARAALGGCSAIRQQYLAVLARGLGIIMTREIAAQEEKEITGSLIGDVIEARASAAGRIGGGVGGQ